MGYKFIHKAFFIICACTFYVSGLSAQQTNQNFETAYDLAYQGKTSAASTMLNAMVNQPSTDKRAALLLASTYSWKGSYDKARVQFNEILSNDKNNREAWISAVKNELYSKNYSTAVGLANKALIYIKDDKELKRLHTMALSGVENIVYAQDGWYNVDSKLNTNFSKQKSKVKPKSVVESGPVLRKTPVTEEAQKNRIAVNSSVTVFDQRFDPITSSSISYKRQTPYGSIIPRINNSNRVGKNGIQLDLDLYPKIAKGFYAYLNYGYSNSELYPNHKVGGDVYYNHKNGLEISGGGRYISFATRDVKTITNSLGYYRGNYYFSLRSYITPSPNQLTKASGNILVRKYLKDAENYMGVNFGIGFSPELRQFSSGDQLLAETLLYIESQRLSFEYQFTNKNSISSYRTNIGVLRQEQSFDPGTFFYSFSAGLTYQFNF